MNIRNGTVVVIARLTFREASAGGLLGGRYIWLDLPVGVWHGFNAIHREILNEPPANW